MKYENPFLINQYLRPKYFIGRKTESSEIFNSLLKSENVLLVCRNGLGKTALIEHVFYQLDKTKKYELIYIDLLKINSLAQFFKKLFSDTISNVSHNSSKQAKKLENILFEENLETTNLFNNLSDEELKTKLDLFISFFLSNNKNFVLAIDNYQISANFSFRKFDEIILQTIEKKLNACLFLSGTKKLFSTENFNSFELKEIAPGEFRSFIYKQFDSIEKKISEKAVSRIINWSKKEPLLIKLICSQLWKSEKKKIKTKDIDKIINVIMANFTKNFEILRTLLSPYQWKLLLAIANEEEATQVTSSNFIKKYELNAPSSVKTALNALLEKELIFKSENYYSISNALLGYWLNKT